MVEERVQGMKGTENRGKSGVESESKKNKRVMLADENPRTQNRRGAEKLRKVLDMNGQAYAGSPIHIMRV